MSDFACPNYTPTYSHWKNVEICINAFECDQGAVRAVRFNADGAYCLTCGSDRKVKLWNPYYSKLLKSYVAHGGDVTDVMASCDSCHLVSGSMDKSVIYWDVFTAQPVRRLRGHLADVTCVCFNEESTLILSGGSDNTVLMWDIRSRRQDPVTSLPEAKDCVMSIRVSDYEILTSSIDCCVRRYDIRNCRLLTDFLGDSVTCANFTHDSQCIVASVADNAVRLIDKLTGEMLGEYKGHKCLDIRVECFTNHDDTLVISGSLGGDIYFWDLASGQLSYQLTHTTGKAIQTIALHPKNDVLLSASRSSVKIWAKPE